MQQFFRKFNCCICVAMAHVVCHRKHKCGVPLEHRCNMRKNHGLYKTRHELFLLKSGRTVTYRLATILSNLDVIGNIIMLALYVTMTGRSRPTNSNQLVRHTTMFLRYAAHIVTELPLAFRMSLRLSLGMRGSL